MIGLKTGGTFNKLLGGGRGGGGGGGGGGFGQSGTDFLVFYNQWQKNRLYFGEANQFQLSWEPDG
jgi:hypothetical protein